MEIQYFIKLIKRRWLFIAFVSVLAAIATFALITVKPREYYSRAQISAGITDNNQVSIGRTELSWSEINNKFTNFEEFLHAKEIFSMLSYRMFVLDVDTKGTYKPVEYAALTKRFSEEEIQGAKIYLQQKYNNLQLLDLTKEYDVVVNEMLKTMYYDNKHLSKVLGIARITGSDYVKIETKTINPNLSSTLVNSYCDEAIRIHNLNETKKAEKSVYFFKQLRDAKKAEFDRKLDSLRRLKSGSLVIDFASQSEAQLDRISTLEEAKSDELKKINGLRRAIANIDGQLGKVEKRTYSNNQTNGSIIHLKSRIQQLNDRYINSNFKDREIADSIAMLKGQLERQLSGMSHTLGSSEASTQKELAAKRMDYEIELSIAEASLSTIDARIGSDKSALSSFVSSGSSLTPLEMAVNLAKDEYMRVEDKFNEAKNQAMKNGALVRQIELAQPADDPEPAQRVLFSTIAFIATLILSLSVLFLISYFDNTIKNPENFLKNTGLPLLGFIYKLPKNQSDVESIFFDDKEDADSKFKEQLRSVRYEVEKAPERILLFTSTSQEEGKSFVMVSLAYSLILNYKRVLIVDTNFKNNTLSDLYKGEANFEDFFLRKEQKLLGTSAVALAGEPVSEKDMEEIIHKTKVEGLDIISCRGNNLSPSEIFHGRKFDELLDKMRSRYDYIFMEGPALNLYSDTKELSSYCEGVIGVFAANTSIKQIDKESIKYLKKIGDKYIGSILNRVEEDDLLI